MKRESSYDAIASMYHALWMDWYLRGAMPALEKLFFGVVPQGSRVLDVCCGSGHVTGELVRRGYRVTGVDSSRELVELAQRALPDVKFCVQDVREMQIAGERFTAAISTFDSLNHLLTLDDLCLALERVREQLETGGRFVFDMNLHEAYAVDLKQWNVDVHENTLGMVRGEYEPLTGRARTELIWFSREAKSTDCWLRRGSVVEQQCYRLEEILAAVHKAGFREVGSKPAEELGVRVELGLGRVFVWAVA